MEIRVSQLGLAEAVDEARLLRVFLAQPGDARRGLYLPAATNTDIPQVAKEGDRLVVLLGLLRRDERIERAPCLGLTLGQCRKVALARVRCFTLTPRLLARRVLRLLAEPLLRALLCRLEELANRAGLGRRGLGRTRLAETTEQLGAKVRLGAAYEAHQERRLLGLGQGGHPPLERGVIDDREFIYDLCEIFNAELRDLAAAGCPLIQVEELPSSRSRSRRITGARRAPTAPTPTSSS